jgi:TolB protein
MIPLVLAAPLGQSLEAVPPGRLVFVVGGDLWEWHAGQARQLTAGERFEGPAWSPQGDQLAVSLVGANHSDVALLSADGSLLRRLTDHRGRRRLQDSDWARLPAWAPDGSRIAYSSDGRTHDLALWTIGPDGSSPRQLFVPPDTSGGVDRASWSPPGNEIALAAWRPGPSQIEVLNPATGRTRRITEAAHGAYDPAWSPSGLWIAHAVRDGTAHDVWLTRPDGSESVRATTTGRNRMPAWSPDGAWLAFLALNDVGFDVRVLPVRDEAGDIEAGEGRVLVSARAVEGASGLTWGP